MVFGVKLPLKNGKRHSFPREYKTFIIERFWQNL
jgi:hypothetical protein